ncbi:helix-turn-helix domain-containing protein [Nocardia higoensis]|uniref:Helix-turn-helix domain-containing protein n=1 Tax=Nocardia higoensis TaxID=228599 RepID=A0ABS0DE22_9NOCA|nr:helix-turn-helix transcriptional regulator [Nocardia higoensis]MBF6356707.1 helix-turn-helix domain-containing protein [Nocardia higoensis]
MADEDSTLPRRQLGRLMRRYRDEVGLTLAQVAQLADIGTTSLHRLERGQSNKVRVPVVQQLCEIYERSPEETAAMRHLAQQDPAKSWFADYGEFANSGFDNYVALESVARRLISYQELIPGLLQTSGYARAIIRGFLAEQSQADVERMVERRVKRQIVIRRRTFPVSLDVVIHESALRRLVGGPRVMADQLRHLADTSTQPNVNVRILPFTAGVPMGVLPGGFVILEFERDGKGRPIEPTVVFIESVLTANIYLERTVDVDRYREISAGLRKAALDDVGSRALIRKIAKEHQP